MAKNIVLPSGMEEWVTVKEAAKLLGYSQAGYVRTLIKKGRLTANLMQVGKKNVYYIDPESIEYYNEHKGTFAATSEFSRYTLRIRNDNLTIDEVEESLTKIFGAKGQDWTLERASQKRTKKSEDETIVATIIEEI